MFYQLALSGLAIAISVTAEQEFRKRQAAQPAPVAAPLWVGPRQRVTRAMKPTSY